MKPGMRSSLGELADAFGLVILFGLIFWGIPIVMWVRK